MQPKKNPKSDLRNYSSLFLAFGLCFILFVSWRAIEAKTYEAQYDYESLNVDDDDDEEIPITEQAAKTTALTRDAIHQILHKKINV